MKTNSIVRIGDLRKMGLPTTIDLAFEGELLSCEVFSDGNGEIVCTAENGRFIKFAGDKDFTEQVEKHNEVNSVPVQLVVEDSLKETELVSSNELETANELSE